MVGRVYVVGNVSSNSTSSRSNRGYRTRKRTSEHCKVEYTEKKISIFHEIGRFLLCYVRTIPDSHNYNSLEREKGENRELQFHRIEMVR